MIAVFDFGIGNLSSVQSGFARAGAETVLVGNADAWYEANRKFPIRGVILPGVGAFSDAMFQLRARGLLTVVREVVRNETPLFGICLGMQMLLSISEEHGRHVGLGLIPGEVVRFGPGLKVPHMGWNDLTRVAEHPLLAGVSVGDFVYFVHSYYARLTNAEDAIAVSQYGEALVPAVIARGNVFGAQFHPEKSGPVGERILMNFVHLCELATVGGERGAR
ncbi:MAG: imidazole glycerol phosphate synthase subunit HisH [Alicyclobacillus herbarius]|uniref:imidazole glycerol phosphate synthase subunit HisH n=1 Tax=Alicyclobacillus herbarius TaxID=122960 RepID=UPI00235635BB|nr:imidazole glycerol phosphate synthase subunit HisH [Alicyclobacillus herbarius]MCL6633380.1 imidazole glycerol phosphate synthase subunit HisH [Alicyclobacillus herbarius]